MIKALFPGNFDPPTYGHFNIVARASRLFDKLDVVISVNPNKTPFFTTQERVELMQKYCAEYKNVTVTHWQGLTVDYARHNNINIIVRGLRPLSDFAYEFEIASINHQLNNEVETMFIPTIPKYSVLRSSSLKEMALFGAEINSLAPPEIIAMVKERIKVDNNS
ncbi:MAG: pantetheine-phosphate adenylyltransferase [Spirochaetaceae bacterium]|nr:pantetheine-phosphate adenylyltransferase [Spirochaetaceae bacterium]